MKRPALVAAGAAATLFGGLATANAVRSHRAKRANPPIGRFAEVDGVKLHYVERGSGPPILLVHGNGTMVQDWIISGLLDDLAKTNRVIAVDRPGFGHSSRPRGRSWAPERQAELLVRFLDEIEVERPLVVGHSYGALVAAALALNHPEQLKGAVVIGGLYYPEARADVAMASGNALPVYGDLINRIFFPLAAEALKRRMNKKIFAPRKPTAAWRDLFPWAFALRPSRARAAAQDAVNMLTGAAALASRWPELPAPVTIVAGAGDKVVNPQHHSRRLHEALPHSRLVMLDGVGHMAHHSAMREVAAAIRQG